MYYGSQGRQRLTPGRGVEVMPTAVALLAARDVTSLAQRQQWRALPRFGSQRLRDRYDGCTGASGKTPSCRKGQRGVQKLSVWPVVKLRPNRDPPLLPLLGSARPQLYISREHYSTLLLKDGGLGVCCLLIHTLECGRGYCLSQRNYVLLIKASHAQTSKIPRFPFPGDTETVILGLIVGFLTRSLRTVPLAPAPNCPSFLPRILPPTPPQDPLPWSRSPHPPWRAGVPAPHPPPGAARSTEVTGTKQMVQKTVFY